MDRLKELLASKNQRRVFIVGTLILVCLTIILAKILSSSPDTTDLSSCQLPVVGSGPALLFFNANQGCDCAMVVYRNADWQILEWKPDQRAKIPIFRLNIEKCHDAARQYQIIMAPALLLIDQEGAIAYRQNFSVSDENPLDLLTFEAKINDLVRFTK